MMAIWSISRTRLWPHSPEGLSFWWKNNKKFPFVLCDEMMDQLLAATAFSGCPNATANSKCHRFRIALEARRSIEEQEVRNEVNWRAKLIEFTPTCQVQPRAYYYNTSCLTLYKTSSSGSSERAARTRTTQLHQERQQSVVAGAFQSMAGEWIRIAPSNTRNP